MTTNAEPREKAIVFISYAREDREFVFALIAGLKEHGVESVGDWHLTPGENYEMRLKEMGMKSHALIFAISPDSIKSEACRNELAFAVECKKQILPVSRRDHGEDSVLDSALRAPQWIFLRDGDDFEDGVKELVTGINTDFALMETHGRLLLAAESWKNNGRNRSYLFRKDGLKEAESWLVKTSVQPEKLPQPTPLEVEFILAGQRARGRATRIAIGVALAVMLSLLVLSIVALTQRSQAVRQAGIARQNEARAVTNEREANRQRTLGVEATNVAIKAQVTALRERDNAQTAETKARTAESDAQTQAKLAKESAAKELVARGHSEARRLETEARLVFGDSRDAGAELVKATLLSVASMRHTRTVDGQISLTRFLGLLPKAPLWRRSVDTMGGTGRDVALAVSPDGARVAVASGGPVQLLDARTGQPLRSFDIPQYSVIRTVLAFSPDGAFLVHGCGPQACVLDTASGQLLARLPDAKARHGDLVWSASFSPDGKLLATSSYGSRDVLVYDVATWQTKATIRGVYREISSPQTSGPRLPGADRGADSVFSVAFSPQGEWLATGDGGGVQLLRVGHYDAPAARVSSIGLVRSIAFQPDGLGLITASQRLQAWRIVPGEGSTTRLEADASMPIEAHTVLPISWHGLRCFAAAASDAVHLLCGTSLDEVLRVPVTSAAMAISPDAHWLFNEQRENTLAAWPLDAGPDVHRIRLGAPVRSMAIAEQRGWLAAGMDNGQVAIVGVDPLKERRRLRLPAAPVDKVIVSSDGQWLAIAQGASLHVFDAGNWREVASSTYGKDVAGIAFDAGDRWLVAVTGTTVVVWQPGGWHERRRLEHTGEIGAVSVSPEGRRLATTTHWTTDDGDVYLTRVFDLASENESGWEYTTGIGISSQQFMRDEAARRQRALVGGDMASVREAVSSWPALEIEEPGEPVSADGGWSVELSESVSRLPVIPEPGPDVEGPGAPSGSVARLHDTAAPNRVIGDFDHGGEITSVRFVPSRAPRWLVTAGEDGTLAVWPIRTADLVHEACGRLRGIFDQKALAKLIADAHAEGSCGAN